MPSSRSKVVRQQQSSPEVDLTETQRREAPPLRTLARPSPFIADGATTEAALCEWAAWFARFHTNPPEVHVPLALRTVDCLVSKQEQQPAEAQAPRLMRCVREVAQFNGAEGTEWGLITWVPGLPGVQFQRCITLHDAMSLLDEPPAPVSFDSSRCR